MIHNLITERKSIRAFSEKPISTETMIGLLEAARWAPSSMNEQPWRFIVAFKNETEEFQRMLECLNEANRNWAKHGAALLLVIAKKFHDNGRENKFAWHDVGLAIGNLSVQATAENIYMHQMGGFREDLAREMYAIPEGYEPVSIIVLGYKGDPESLPENLKQRELKARERIPLSDLIYTKTFGERKF